MADTTVDPIVTETPQVSEQLAEPTQTAQSAPTNSSSIPADQPQQGFLSRATSAFTHPMQTLKTVGNDIVQAGGHPAPTYTTDDTGKLVEQVGKATPGTLFKNLLVGALTGIGGAAQDRGRGGVLGAAGAGFSASMAAVEN